MSKKELKKLYRVASKNIEKLLSDKTDWRALLKKKLASKKVKNTT